MAERYQRGRRERQLPNEDTYGFGQAEQYDDSTYEQDSDLGQRDRGFRGQMGDRGGARPGGGAYYYEETTIIPRRTSGSQRRDFSGYGASSDNRQDRGYGDEYRGGGRDFERGGRERGGTYLDRDHMNYDERPRGSGDYRASDRSRGYNDRSRHDRGFFEKAGDEIASWFGDEDAARRRQKDHRGSGPSNYTRSDDRILEDACDNLTDDWAVDARNIQVTVKEGEVTLDGTVDSRSAKRRAEDCVDCISGVKHVQNNLRVQDRIGENADYSERELDEGRI